VRSVLVLAITFLAIVSSASAGARTHHEDAETQVQYRTIAVDGVKVFYREAGPTDAPVVLLLHGFPSSSFMFRNLIAPLAQRYRVLAPDYPGFGQSDFPDPRRYAYSFESIAKTMSKFAAAVGARSYALAGWDPLKAYWREPTATNREALRGWLTREGIREQYVAGVPEALHGRFAPETWTLDWALLQRPGNIDVQLDLFGDYRHNVALYPAIQRMFREQRFPTLIVWGRHDVFFTEAGARAYRRDLPDAELQWLETGHFALETHHEQIAALMLGFLGRHVR
jgi:pimeloyl-ACP methyl ester carboxylesterase